MKLNLLHAALFTPTTTGWGLPIILWGAPGTTKTASIKALGRKFGLHVEHLAPGERGEGAFGVTPVPKNTEGGVVLAYPAPEWVQALRATDGQEQGIVFLDEINTAPPALQPALLGALQEGRVGGHTFGPRVRRLGAANPVGQSAGGWDLAAPVANRAGHIDWPAPEVDDWASWLLAGAGVDVSKPLDARKEEARVMAEWPEAFAVSSGVISAFLRARPELLHKMPKDGDPSQSRAWPSPRTWEMAARAYAGSIVHRLTETERDEFLCAFVGAGPAGELTTFLTENDLPAPAKLLDGEISFTHDPERLDRTVVVLNACSALVAPKDAAKRNDRAEALWKLVSVVSEDAKDVVVPAMTALVASGLHSTPSSKKVMARMHSVITTAGVLARE